MMDGHNEKHLGITPACAGKTGVSVIPKHLPEDHPRLRGKDVSPALQLPPCVGSPPLARERRERRKRTGDIIGITPACAGKTGLRNEGLPREGDHPRLRGKDAV